MVTDQQRKQRGRSGETLAKGYLLDKGYQFIRQNYHSRFGEIDLIFYDKTHKEYMFVEVKMRTNDEYGGALESVTPAKLKKVYYTGIDFLKSVKRDKSRSRLDAVCIDIQEKDVVIEHYENLSFYK